MTVNVVGQGAVNQTSRTVHEYWPADQDVYYDANVDGTAWTLTAVPTAPATFDRWEITYHYKREWSSDGGATWTTRAEDDFTDTFYGSPITAGYEHAFIGYGRYICFEGTRIEGNSGSPYVTRYTFTNQNVTAYFKSGHIPTHKIIRDDSTGKIMRGGTQNKILRDD